MELIRVNAFHGMISPVVAEEISKAPAHVRELLEAFDEEHIVRLEETDAVLRLTDAYMNARVVPPSYQADAAHIAYATIHNADVVVSWNFRHIVNYQRIHAFN